MAKKRILILGAGLSGLSAAWHLQRLGIDCQILEKEAEVGGLCRSKEINGSGFTFDSSGHLLHFKNNYALRLVKKLVGKNLIRHKRNAWIYSYGKFTRYPFQANLYGLPKQVVKECLLEFLKTHHNGLKTKGNNLSFRRWINNTFGRGIASHFMIPYNTKFWTVSLDELTCEWIDGFIPIPTLNQIVEGTIKESRQNLGYNAFFWYPAKGGISTISQAFANQIINIFKGCKATKIDLESKTIRINGNEKERFDFLISTIPLPELRRLLCGLPERIDAALKNLKWNSIFNLNIGIDRALDNSWHWIYFPEKEFSFFRVGFPQNFSPYLTPSGRGSIYIEVSYSLNKPVNKNNIFLRVKKDLRKAGILSRDDRICLEDTNDIKYGYPIYDVNYRNSRERILSFLSDNNIIPCGRYGSWRYMSMEDVILDGKITAERLIRSI